MAYRPAHGAKVIGESERPNEQDRARCCTSTTSQDSTTALTLAYRQSLSSQGRQAHASAANTAITRVLYIAHRGAAHTAPRPSCSDICRAQLPFHSLPLPTSCRSRRTRTHVCKPSRPSRGPAASASACAFGCPRGRAKPASAATLRSIYATASTKMARVAGIEDFQVEMQWSRSGRTS
jgi:hypothetical protein